MPVAPRRPESVLAVLVALAALGGCVTTPAEDDPLQVKIDDMDRRLGRVERVAGGQTLVDMSQRIDALQAEVRRLRGQVEVLENANEALRKQQRDLYGDLSRRLETQGGVGASTTGAAGTVGGASLGSAAATTSSSPAAPAARSADTPEARYGRAFDALKASNYPAAITGMRSASTHCGISAMVPTRLASSSPRNVPRCPPASMPWAMIMSAPCFSSQRASATVVAEESTLAPQLFTRASKSAAGNPK